MARKREYFFEYKMGYMMTIASIVSIVVIALSVFLMYICFGIDDLVKFVYGKTSMLLIGFVIIFLWSALHEIIHGLFYILGGADKKNVTYGAALEKGIFYCRCGEYINKKTIMKSLMAPFTIIGVITLIIGFALKQWWLISLSAINIGGAGADLCMFFFFLKRKDDLEFKEYGDSSYFSLKTAEFLENKKFSCVKLIDRDKVPANNNSKRLVVSKASLWTTLLFLVLFIVLIVLEIFI